MSRAQPPRAMISVVVLVCLLIMTLICGTLLHMIQSQRALGQSVADLEPPPNRLEFAGVSERRRGDIDALPASGRRKVNREIADSGCRLLRARAKSQIERLSFGVVELRNRDDQVRVGARRVGVGCDRYFP